MVGIRTPDGHEGYNNSVRLSNQSLVTSGSYERSLTVDGVSYHHIIHPNTGYPVTTHLSVSVLCDNSARADALSTALFSMTLEDGVELVNSLPDTEAVWLEADGSTVCSDGFETYTVGGTP